MSKIWIVIGIGAVVVAGMLGLTLGINLNPASSVRYVWDWGIAGGWVSGLGAMAAAIVAVHQSMKNSANEKIRFTVADRSAADSWNLRVVSEGLIPATVLGVELIHGEKRYKLPMQISSHSGLRFPTRLDRGDVLELFDLEGSDFHDLGKRLLDPVSAELEREGRSPDGYRYELDEGYFDILRSYGEKPCIIKFRFAHDDYEHQVTQVVVRALITGHSNRLREETEARVDQWKKNLRRDVAEMQRLIELGDDGEP